MKVPLHLVSLGNSYRNIIFNKFGVSQHSLNTYTMAEKFLSITLQDEGVAKEAVRLIVDQLIDPNHNSVQHIRDLTIAGFGVNEDFLSAPELETIIANIKILTTFR